MNKYDEKVMTKLYNQQKRQARKKEQQDSDYVTSPNHRLSRGVGGGLYKKAIEYIRKSREFGDDLLQQEKRRQEREDKNHERSA